MEVNPGAGCYNEDNFPPRSYQIELMKIALEQNTIIFLPTGTGKTYIAIMVLKRMSEALLKPFNEGGKLTVVLVNSVALVSQHTKNLIAHTNFSVGPYSGDLNVDCWNLAKWQEEFNKHQVLVMTCQILLNLLNQHFIGLNNINLMIFDECHHGVNDHPMRQIMFHFESCKEQPRTEQPRILGLTATLLNANCKPAKVMEIVRALEVTFLSKIATIDELVHIVGFSTNPVEHIQPCNLHICSKVEQLAINHLNRITLLLKYVKLENCDARILSLEPLESNEGMKRLVNLIRDLKIHIEELGIYGGYICCLSHMIQVERIKLHCSEATLLYLLNAVLTCFGFVKSLFLHAMKSYSEKDKIHTFSSDKVQALFKTFKEYATLSREDLCALVFVQRRFTAKVLYHILKNLAKTDDEFSHIKPNFIVGYSNNPYNTTRESLYICKKNKQILEGFMNKEVNVLVASNLLEEGVDILKCTLVIKFNKPVEYRSYIQSKGRARHKTSHYYIIVERNEAESYCRKYVEFQEIETILNNFLVGKNDERKHPTPAEIDEMYRESDLIPYHVSGPNSAQINMLSAISLLSQYCQNLPCDRYTTYTPDWYLKKRDNIKFGTEYSVVIVMPLLCPISKPIEGKFMPNKLLAKRAAAYKACIELHKCGALNDNLIPMKHSLPEENVSFLFKHWPKDKDLKAGNTKMRRLYKKQRTSYLEGHLQTDEPHFLHIIQVNPEFARNTDNPNNAAIHDMYTSTLCFGFITPKMLPNICNFPIYVSTGTIRIGIEGNKQVLLTSDQISDIKMFHYAVFKDLLEIVKEFLIIDDDVNGECLFIVPVDKILGEIRFDILAHNRHIKNKQEELKLSEKMSLAVDDDTYFHKIVTPWYRREPSTYLVTCVRLDMSPLSQFPNEEFGSFKDYFLEKYEQKIYKEDQPLLLVKGLSKRINMLKPRGIKAKRKKDKMYEELEEMLIPELLVKQEFEACLWVQAGLLPSVFTRLMHLFSLEELRRKIALEAKLGKAENENSTPLEIDLHLINYDPVDEEKDSKKSIIMVTNQDECVTEDLTALTVYNKDFAAKMLEAEFPWSDIEEPKDIERVIEVSLMDVEYYEKFIGKEVKKEERSRNSSPSKGKLLPAITYHKEFVEKEIQLIKKSLVKDGPELCEMYRAMTTAKSNDLVNLERLETLGDSFLKFISSTYIFLRFPEFDEGRCSTLKGRLVSNKNLYYHAVDKGLGGIIKHHDLSREEWLPPSFKLPNVLENKIIKKEISVNSVFFHAFTTKEQIQGVLSKESINSINKETLPIEIEEDSSYQSLCHFLRHNFIGDKFVADAVESLLGLYCESFGILVIAGRTFNFVSDTNFLGLQFNEHVDWETYINSLCGKLNRICYSIRTMVNYLNEKTLRILYLANFESVARYGIIFWGGIKLIEWLNIIPKTENLRELLTTRPPNPIINNDNSNISFHLPQWRIVEERLGYNFRNPAYLLQALTHSSYTPNRTTHCYQKLEYLGDAVLDFLITCYIYESCGCLTPGELTDLRSALVNNNTFASFVVRCGFHKFLLMMNMPLQNAIDKFSFYLETKNYEIDDEVLILLEEDNCNIAEFVDVPKVLGDIFEALAGAIYLDSGYSLQTVWKIFYKIMWREIDMFSQNVPKNVIRRLFEWPNAYPIFGKSKPVDNKTMVPLDFMLNGRQKVVHGFGDSKALAKKAAAKIALRFLEK